MLTIERQCELLGIPRSTYYYKPKPKDSAVDEMREAAMRAIDDIHLEMPFAGARKISRELRKMGFPYGRHATKTLMDTDRGFPGSRLAWRRCLSAMQPCLAQRAQRRRETRGIFDCLSITRLATQALTGLSHVAYHSFVTYMIKDDKN